MQEIKVLAPATVSNVVCGFDCLGFALSEPCEEITLRRADDGDIHISHLDNFGLSCVPESNVAGVALEAFRTAAGIAHGYEVEINKRIKPGSGIGSSSASSGGVVFAAQALEGTHFSKQELVEIAMAGEVLASGSRHADNLAPCMFGGFTLVRAVTPLDIVEIDFPDLYATVIHPQIEIKTSQARAILPTDVPLTDAVKNWSNLAALVSGLAKGDHDLIARSMEDLIVEPARKQLIPKFDEVKAVSLAAGAMGGGISGSGPSIFMLSAEPAIADLVAEAMSAVYDGSGIEYLVYVSEISRRGVRMA